MNEKIKMNRWVYIIVQDPDRNEQFLGQHDEEADISFIPFFMEKDDAMQCLPILVRDIFKKFEVHAILYEDLLSYADENSFQLYLLSGKGEILDKIAP